MTNTALIKQLGTIGLDVGSFDYILELNAEIGGHQIPVHNRPSVFQTIGIPKHFILQPHDISVPFFDFGVAAPCSIELHQTGSVIADFGDGLPIEAAETLEVFMEGLALESLAGQRFGQPGGTQLVGDIAAFQVELPRADRIQEASDRWTTWWQNDEYFLRLSAMWDYFRTVNVTAWHHGPLPSKFADLLTD